MPRILNRMPTPLGIGAGQTASCELPRGLTYERLYINLNVNVTSGGTTTATDVKAADWKDYIDEIRLNVNGESRIVITAGDLVKLNQFYGQTLKDGVLPLFLSRPWMRTPNGEDQTAYGTAAGMSSFILEMDLKSGITINKLDVYAVQSDPKPFGPHLRIERYVHNQGVVGEAEITGIKRGAYVLSALHVTTDKVGDVEVHLENRKIIDANPAIRSAHAEVSGRALQSGMTHIDMVDANRLNQNLPMTVNDFRLNCDFQEVGNYSIYAESIQSAA